SAAGFLVSSAITLLQTGALGRRTLFSSRHAERDVKLRLCLRGFAGVGSNCSGFRGSSGLTALTLHARVADLFDLRQALVFNIRADADELDDLFGHAQAALDLLDQLARSFDRQQNVEAVNELANEVRQTALAHLLRVLHGAAGIGNVRLHRGD